MTLWLMDSSGVEGEYPDFKPYIAMPAYNEQDWSKATSPQWIQHRLNAKGHNDPPEHIARLAKTIWRFVGRMEPEDIICVVQKKGSKPSRVYFAEVVGPVQYHHAEAVHLLPVKWFNQTVGMLRLRPYITYLEDADTWPVAVDNKKLRIALRNLLPLPGNRFAKWALIILLIVLAAKLLRMSGHFWK